MLNLKNTIVITSILLIISPFFSGISAQPSQSSQNMEQLIVTYEGTRPAVRILDLATGEVIKTLHHNDWKISGAGRPVVIDQHGHIWVCDVENQTIYQFDRYANFIRSFEIDTSGIGSPPGAGFRSFVFGEKGTLFAVGGWLSATENYLFEIDPETEETLKCTNLDAITGSKFEPARMTLGPDGLLYITEWSGSGQGQHRIAVIDPAEHTLNKIIKDPIFGINLGSIYVLPGGSIALGDFSNGTLWLSDPKQAIWNELISGPNIGNYSIFYIGHGYAYASYNRPGWISVIKLSNGSVVLQIDTGLPNIHDISIIH